MLHELLEREESLKAAALRAADAGDWRAVADTAKNLVATYRAILASGLVPGTELSRWTALRDRWEAIGAEASAKVPASESRKTARKTCFLFYLEVLNDLHIDFMREITVHSEEELAFRIVPDIITDIISNIAVHFVTPYRFG